jgi:hypothetical protein
MHSDCHAVLQYTQQGLVKETENKISCCCCCCRRRRRRLTSSVEGNGLVAPVTTTVSHLNTGTRRYGDWLRAGRSRVRIPVRKEGFSSSKRPYRLYGRPSNVFYVYRSSFLGVKRPGHEANHSPPSSAHRNSSVPAQDNNRHLHCTVTAERKKTTAICTAQSDS